MGLNVGALILSVSLLGAPAAQNRVRTIHVFVALCDNKHQGYSQPHLSQWRSKSVLLTTGFMAPEAYTLEAAVAGWLANETADRIKERAASAYDKYQKCGLPAARHLFYSE